MLVPNHFNLKLFAIVAKIFPRWRVAPRIAGLLDVRLVFPTGQNFIVRVCILLRVLSNHKTRPSFAITSKTCFITCSL
jgi:hypothetical protein